MITKFLMLYLHVEVQSSDQQQISILSAKTPNGINSLNCNYIFNFSYYFLIFYQEKNK